MCAPGPRARGSRSATPADGTTAWGGARRHASATPAPAAAASTPPRVADRAAPGVLARVARAGLRSGGEQRAARVRAPELEPEGRRRRRAPRNRGSARPASPTRTAHARSSGRRSARVYLCAQQPQPPTWRRLPAGRQARTAARTAVETARRWRRSARAGDVVRGRCCSDAARYSSSCPVSEIEITRHETFGFEEDSSGMPDCAKLGASRASSGSVAW